MEAAETVLHVAAAARDAAGVAVRPGALAVRRGRIVASGTPADVRRALDRRPDREVDHGDVLLLPAFVNAHAHLDLSRIGPRPAADTFVDWVRMVIRERPQGPADIHAAVHGALRESRRSGVGWIGDVAGSSRAVDARARAPADAIVPGVAWLEVFGIGPREERGADVAEARLSELRTRHADTPDLRIDLQPHAPYSAGLGLYERAARLGAPTTHLAETLEEAEFVATARGPFRELLASVGEWDDAIRPLGGSPVRALEPVLRRAPWVLAHCNYVDDEDLDVLARCPGIAVAYCPIASEYFGHRGHRYRDMLARGVDVCLGTDSVICQPAAEPAPHGILAPCRRLFVRDGTDPSTLLAMATVNGARALRLRPGSATLAPGAPARIQAVPFDASDAGDGWEQVLADASRHAVAVEPT